MAPDAEARIAAIVPVYQRPTILLDALRSILDQSRPPDRLIVVDDGSTDHTAARARVWLEHHAKNLDWQLLEQPNRGAGAARNHGANQARDCHLLAFLDSDDLWPTDYLERAAEAMRHHPEAVAVAFDKINLEASTGEQTRIDTSWAAGDSLLRMLRNGPPGLSNSVYRAEPFFKIGGFNTAMRTGQDYDLMLRVSLLGPWAHALGAPVTYRHRIGDSAGEAGALSHAYDDRRLKRALNLTHFIYHGGGRAALEEKDWQPVLAARWFKAGRQLEQLRRPFAAAHAYRCAQRHGWGPRAALRLALLRPKVAGQAPDAALAGAGVACDPSAGGCRSTMLLRPPAPTAARRAVARELGRQVGRLLAAGLVLRQPDPGDWRASFDDHGRPLLTLAKPPALVARKSDAQVLQMLTQMWKAALSTGPIRRVEAVAFARALLAADMTLAMEADNRRERLRLLAAAIPSVPPAAGKAKRG